MELVTGLVQALLVASAGFFLWLGITDGRVSWSSLRLGRPSPASLDRIAGAPSALTPRTIRQTPLG
jgi:hypothetical protein